MIEKLTLSNFQAHSKLEIQFDARITSIVGPTDTGKSSIIRALWWLIKNTPNGSEFIRHGAKFTCVELEVDGQLINRTRGSGENSYNLNSDEFKAFGVSVPPEIEKLLRIEDINKQSQHDSPFWFGLSSAGEVSRRLNAIVDLGIIDSVLSVCGLRCSRAKETARIVEERLQAAKKQLEELDYVVELDADLTAVEEAGYRAAEAQKRAGELFNLLTDLDYHLQQKENLEVVAGHGTKLLKLLEEYHQRNKQADELYLLIKAARLSKEAAVKVPDFHEVEQTWKNLGVYWQEASSLATAIENMRTLFKGRRAANEEYEAAHKEFHQKVGNICPLCQQKLPHP